MYLDGVVVASLVTVAMVLVIFLYLGYYGYHRLREEEQKAAEQEKKPVEPFSD